MSDDELAQVAVLPPWLFVRNGARAHGLLLTREAKAALVARLRAGERAARDELICAFLRYCEALAYRYSAMYAGRVEYEDLFQIAALKIVETLDQALARYTDPCPYLVVAARREVVEHCLWRAYLVRIPETRDAQGRAVYKPLHLEPLEAAEEVEGPALPATSAAREHERLRSAVASLTGRYRQVIELRFGLAGNAPAPLEAISLAISAGRTKTMAGSYQRLALDKLRKYMSKEARDA